MKTRTVLLGLMACAGLMLSLAVQAQGDSRRPFRIIVGFAPGGPIDIGARVIAPKMEERLKQPVLVENRPGGNAVIAAAAAANAAPDGMTMFMQSVAVMTPVMIKDFPLDILRDMEPVAPVWSFSYYLFINSGLPARTLPEFVAYAKANPGKLNYAIGTSSAMLLMEALKAKYGLDIVGVQYKGSAPAAVALTANEVQATFDVAGILKPQVDAGKARVLFKGGRSRGTVFPDVPTAAEIGVPDQQFALTGGLWTRAGAPRPVVEQVSRVVGEVMALPDVAERYNTIGWDVSNNGREELLRSVRSQMDFLSRAAKLANYKPE